MKRMLSTILTASLLGAALSGCGSKPAQESSTTQAAATTQAPTKAEAETAAPGADQAGAQEAMMKYARDLTKSIRTRACRLSMCAM